MLLVAINTQSILKSLLSHMTRSLEIEYWWYGFSGSTSVIKPTLVLSSGSFLYGSKIVAAASTFILTFHRKKEERCQLCLVLWFRKAKASLGTTSPAPVTWTLPAIRQEKETTGSHGNLDQLWSTTWGWAHYCLNKTEIFFIFRLKWILSRSPRESAGILCL